MFENEKLKELQQLLVIQIDEINRKCNRFRESRNETMESFCEGMLLAREMVLDKIRELLARE